jgi:hypothetical protein
VDLVPLTLGAAPDLDANPVRIEDEELVVALDVAVVLGREVDFRAHLEAARVGGVHLLSRVDVEGEVLDADVVVPVLAAVRRPRNCSP